MTPGLRVLAELDANLRRALYPDGRPRRPRWRVAAPLGGLAAAVAALVALVLALSGSGGVPSTAAAALDRAARSAAQRPAPPSLRAGSFWYTRSEGTARFPIPIPLGPRRLPFVFVTQRIATETWLDPAGTLRTRVSPIGAPSFASPADLALVAASRIPLAKLLTAARATDATDQGDGRFPAEQDLFSYAELQGLPQDPRALLRRIDGALAAAQARASQEYRATLSQLAARPPADGATRTFTVTTTQAATTLFALQGLLESPVPPAVRAALYRAAALVPGIRLDAAAHDALGRPGTGIATGTGSREFELVVDPASGALLGRNSPGGADSATLATGVVDSIVALPAGVAPIAATPGVERVGLAINPTSGGAETAFTVLVQGTSTARLYAFAVIGPARPTCQQTLFPELHLLRGAHRLAFLITPVAGGRCPGTYRVEVSANAHPVGSVRFSVR